MILNPRCRRSAPLSSRPLIAEPRFDTDCAPSRDSQAADRGRSSSTPRWLDKALFQEPTSRWIAEHRGLLPPAVRRRQVAAVLRALRRKAAAMATPSTTRACRRRHRPDLRPAACSPRLFRTPPNYCCSTTGTQRLREPAARSTGRSSRIAMAVMSSPANSLAVPA